MPDHGLPILVESCGFEPRVACRDSAAGRSGAQCRSRTCDARASGPLRFPFLSVERALSEGARSTLGFEFSTNEALKSHVGRDPGIEPGQRESDAALTRPSPDARTTRDSCEPYQADLVLHHDAHLFLSVFRSLEMSKAAEVRDLGGFHRQNA